MKIAVIGSGGWGTAIAILLSSRGHNVYLWSWIQEETDRLKKDRENKEFLPGVKFPDTIYCSHDMAKCTDGAELIITAAPSPATKTTASSAIIKPKKTARFPKTTDNMAGEEATYNDVRAVTTRARNIRPYTLRITIDKTDVPVADL